MANVRVCCIPFQLKKQMCQFPKMVEYALLMHTRTQQSKWNWLIQSCWCKAESPWQQIKLNSAPVPPSGISHWAEKCSVSWDCFYLIHFDHAVDLGDKPKAGKESNCTWRQKTQKIQIKKTLHNITWSIMFFSAVKTAHKECLQTSYAWNKTSHNFTHLNNNYCFLLKNIHFLESLMFKNSG